MDVLSKNGNGEILVVHLIFEEDFLKKINCNQDFIVEKIKKLQNVILEFFGDGDYVPTIFKVRKEFPMAKSGKRDTVKMKAETEGFFTIDK